MATIEQRLKFILDKRSQQDAKRGAEELEAALNDVVRSVKDGSSSYDEARRDLSKLAREFESTEESAERLNRTIRKLDDIRLNRLNDEFDNVSRNVGLAGDVQSNLGALSGLAGATGANNVASGIGTAGELIVLVEELPRLKTALTGLPQTISASAKALGTTSVGLIGALGASAIAIAAVALAFREFTKDAEEQAQVLRNLLSAQGDVNRQIVDGLTTASAQEQIARNEQLIELERERLARLEDAYRSFEEQAGSVIGAIAKVISPQEQALVDEINSIRDSISQLEQTNNALNVAIDNGQTTTAQANAAEIELAATREETTQKTEQVAQAEKRNTEIRQRQIQQDQARLQAQREAQQAAERAADAQRKYSESVAKTGSDLQDSIDDIEREFARDLSRGLIDAQRDATRNFEDSIAAGDFLGLSQAQVEFERGQEDIRREAERDRRDALQQTRIDNQRQLRELRIQKDQELAVIRNGRAAIVAEFGAMMGDLRRAAGGSASIPIGDVPTGNQRTSTRNSFILSRVS